MLFSVIVPIYKTEKYLKQCVDSILTQRFSDFEVILVDDGSPDNCPAMIDKMAESDNRIVPIHKPNGGLVSARKAGMYAAHGDYIVNIDSDDFVGTDFLSDIAKNIEEHSPDAVFFGYTLYTESENGNVGRKTLNSAEIGIYKEDKISYLRSTYLYDESRPNINGGCSLFNICCKAIRKDLYIKNQDAVPDVVVSGEDTLFTMNLLQNASSIFISDNCHYYYRQNPQSIEHSVTKKDFTNLSTVFREMESICKVYGISTNPSYVYVLYRVWALAIRNAKSARSFSEYKKNISDPVYRALLKTAKNANVSSPKATEKIVIFALKNKMFFFIYLLGKTWFKNKDF
ncbi:MAG: glycosyltransferase family 2 protein [Clostridia bacterium]|nr:glycosyltransferase family 2 protein [Clostridia bacterium]